MIIGIVNNSREEYHECTYKSSNIKPQTLIEINLRITDRNRNISHFILIIQIIVIINLLTNFMSGIKQPYNFIPLRGPINLFHNPRPCTSREICKDCMPWKEENLITISRQLIIIHRYLYSQ